MDTHAISLADEFLADLESDEEEEVADEEPTTQTNNAQHEQETNERPTDDDQVMESGGAPPSRADALENISKLLFDDRIATLKQKMAQYTQDMEKNQNTTSATQKILLERQATQASSESKGSSPYALTVECNTICVEMEEELARIHKLVQDLFGKRFYDLESLVVNPMDYMRVVQRLAPAEKLSQVELGDLLPGPTVMVIKMSASNATSSVSSLSEEEIQRIQEACAGALRLEKERQEILSFVQSRMNMVAPNLSALVGTKIAASLIGSAGGLLALSRLPASTIQVLGSDRKTLEGLSTISTVKKHVGFIYDCELVQETPPAYRKKTIRVLAPKCTLAARLDAHSQDQSDHEGQQMKEEIEKKIDKWQERPPAKQIKALPAPDDKVKPTRGGKRVRKMKERYAVTELRKYANRMAFGVEEETHGNTDQGFGMLGSANRVKLHVVRDKKLQKQLHHRQMMEERKQRRRGVRTNVGGASGLASTLAMTPVQGMELVDPEAAAKRVKEANQKYFGKSGTFTRVSNPNMDTD